MTREIFTRFHPGAGCGGLVGSNASSATDCDAVGEERLADGLSSTGPIIKTDNWPAARRLPR